MWTYSNPVKIIFTNSLTDTLKSICPGQKKILVVCEEYFQKSEEFNRLRAHFQPFKSYTSIEINPSFKSCQQALTLTKKIKPDTIIAIGGGSVIDTAKAMRMASYKLVYDIESLLKNPPNRISKPMLIAIPTTHGTGSELTMWATVWNKKEKKKYSLSEYNNYPDYAIYYHHLLETLPLNISLSSSLDALSHSFESIWNKNHNPLSDQFALQAIKIIYDNIDQITEPITIQTRKKMLMASMYAGLAFSNTKTAAAHSISYPLSAYFDIPHGIACSMPLFPLLKITRKAIQNQIAQLLGLLNISTINQFEVKINKTVHKKVAFKLHEYGVKKNDLNWIVKHCFKKDRMGNHIVELSEANVFSILKEIF